MRIVLVDDHPIVLKGLEQLLQRQPDFEVVGACADADSAVAAVRNLHPDVLVLDLRMPRQGGLSILKALNELGVRTRTVLLTAAISDQEVVEAVTLGVAGLVLKESTPDTLLTCLRTVHRGDNCFDREVATRAFQTVLDREKRAREIAQILTPREIDVVRLVAEGHRNRDIADRLRIVEGTVKVHLHYIYEKLNVDGRLELVLIAQQRGLVS